MYYIFNYNKIIFSLFNKLHSYLHCNPQIFFMIFLEMMVSCPVTDDSMPWIYTRSESLRLSINWSVS